MRGQQVKGSRQKDQILPEHFFFECFIKDGNIWYIGPVTVHAIVSKWRPTASVVMHIVSTYPGPITGPVDQTRTIQPRLTLTKIMNKKKIYQKYTNLPFSINVLHNIYLYKIQQQPIHLRPQTGNLRREQLQAVVCV